LRDFRIDAINHDRQSPRQGVYPAASGSAPQVQRSMPDTTALPRLKDAAAVARAGLRKTFVDHGQQRDRRERLVQRAAPSSSAMRRKSGAGESSNMRHEDIDDHQVEGCLVERRESAGAPSETATLNPFAPEPCPYREAKVRVTVDNQNAAHHDLLAIAGRLRVIDCTAIFAAPISSRFLFPPQAGRSVCPERCISISRRSVDRVGNHPPRPIISWKRMSMKALPLRDRYSDADATAVRGGISTRGR